jgi:hypothetical protein
MTLEREQKMVEYCDFEEAYEITKTFEIVSKRDFDGGGGPSTLRIEIVHCLQTGKYSVRWSQQTSFRLQPSYPVVDGGFAQPTGDFSVWVPLADMPWVDENDESRAVQRAFSWLKDRGA